MRLRIRASIIAAAGDGVERPDGGGAPTAFRVWKAGANETDYGTHLFTEKSAKQLMAEQAARGNLYSIDVDHLSLNKESPPEARRAVGWHRLEVRDTKGGPELWATELEWTDVVKAGLEKDPPEWRYFSPAYDVEKKTGEIVSYLNTALTNNPATWSITALASRTERAVTMNYKAMSAALMAWAGDDDKKKEEATAQLASMFPDGDKDEGESKPKDEKEATTATEEPKEEPVEEPKPKDEKEATKASKVAGEAELLKTIGEQDRRLKDLEKTAETAEREKIVASRPDLTEAQKKYLAAQPVTKVRELLEVMVAPVGELDDVAAASRVTATRGSTRTGDGETSTVRAARLPPKQHEELAARFGRSSKVVTVHMDRNDLVLPQITKAEALKILARHGATAPAPRPQLAAPLQQVVREVRVGRPGGAR